MIAMVVCYQDSDEADEAVDAAGIVPDAVAVAVVVAVVVAVGIGVGIVADTLGLVLGANDKTRCRCGICRRHQHHQAGSAPC